MRSILQQEGYDQVPQLTSSRMVDVSKPLSIVPSSSSKKKAVLIGINYIGQNGELRGCHNDVYNMMKYLQEKQGFSKDDIVVLMDDGKHTSPTKRSILDAFQRLARQSSSGDAVFVHYSGHGGRIKDQGSDEADGYDETLIPLDFAQAGQIRDDDVLRVLVSPMPAGVTLTCLFDSCHSGTVLDLPYQFTASDTKMHRNNRFKLSKMGTASAFPCLLNLCNLLAYTVNAALTYGIGVLGLFGLSTNDELSVKYQTLITPVGWTFGIWALIFIAELVWSVLQLVVPTIRSSPLVRRGVGWYWIGVCLAQCGWTVAFAMEIIWLSLVAMLSILVFLLLIVVTQYRIQTSVSLKDYILLKWPFLLHCGWIMAASMVNINVLLVDLQLSTNVLYYSALASLVVILGIALFALFYPARKDLTIPMVLAWATAGIYVELENPQQSIVETFESPFYYSVVQYGAIAVCGVIVFLSIFVAICNCRSVTADRQKGTNASSGSASDTPPGGGDYHKMAEV